MAPDRIPLNTDDTPHNEPFITSIDHLRERQDKSKMPWPDSESREQDDGQQRSHGSRASSRSKRRRRSRSRAKRRRSRREQAEKESGKDPEAVERKAMQKVIRQLKEKGMSDAFIEENMDKIQERVRNELR